MEENLNLKELVDLISKEVEMKLKAPGTSGTATPLHGVTRVGAGLFSSQGVERDVLSTVVRPFGIAEELPVFPTTDQNPLFAAITGVSDDIGSETATPCGDPPTGYMKAANLSAQFGYVVRGTETIDINEVAMRINRGDFRDLRFAAGFPGMDKLNPVNPRSMSANQLLDVMTVSEMFQTGIRMERVLAKQMWQGSPANNNVGGGYKEFPGLAKQIATGQKDWETGTLAPALDSDVKDFTYENADGSGSKNLVTYVSEMEHFLYTLARKTGMLPMEMVIAMRPDLWQIVSSVWPIQYNTTYQAILSTGAQVVVDGRQNVADRDAMRSNMTLAVNGRVLKVIVDDGIEEDTPLTDQNLSAGEYSSSIFFIPLRGAGKNLTFIEHMDYRATDIDSAILGGGKTFYWTDNGRWMWNWDNTGGWCYQGKVKTEMRVVLLTPQLAGRIDNVKYTPLQHSRDYDPDSPYFVNGGVSFRTGSTGNAVWA